MRRKPLFRAVFDCNVFLQAAARPDGPSGKCLQHARVNDIKLFISRDILLEISDVLQRPEIRQIFTELSDIGIRLFLDEVKNIAEFLTSPAPVFHLLRDVDDQPYIDLAVAASADLIVSRDRDLLDLMTAFSDEAKEFRRKFRPLKIIDPVDLLHRIEVAIAEMP